MIDYIRMNVEDTQTDHKMSPLARCRLYDPNFVFCQWLEMFFVFQKSRTDLGPTQKAAGE